MAAYLLISDGATWISQTHTKLSRPEGPFDSNATAKATSQQFRKNKLIYALHVQADINIYLFSRPIYPPAKIMGVMGQL